MKIFVEYNREIVHRENFRIIYTKFILLYEKDFIFGGQVSHSTVVLKSNPDFFRKFTKLLVKS